MKTATPLHAEVKKDSMDSKEVYNWPITEQQLGLKSPKNCENFP